MAAGSARSRTSSSPLTSMRSAWKVRLAGLPPVRRAGAGMESRTSSTSRALVSNGAPAALAHDRVGDPAGELLLAVLAQHARELGGGVGVEHLGGGDAARGVHAHVERRVLRVGEAALGLVELHGARRRGRTGSPSTRGSPSLGEHLRQLVVHRVHQHGAPGVRREPATGELEGVEVAVEADEADLRESLRAAPRCGRRGRASRRRRRRRGGRGPEPGG